MLPYDEEFARLSAGDLSHDETHSLLFLTHDWLADTARICDRDGNDDAREAHNEVRLAHQARYPGCTHRWWELTTAEPPGGGAA